MVVSCEYGNMLTGFPWMSEEIPASDKGCSMELGG